MPRSHTIMQPPLYMHPPHIRYYSILLPLSAYLLNPEIRIPPPVLRPQMLLHPTAFPQLPSHPARPSHSPTSTPNLAPPSYFTITPRSSFATPQGTKKTFYSAIDAPPAFSAPSPGPQDASH
jgi:hypothetical protein